MWRNLYSHKFLGATIAIFLICIIALVSFEEPLLLIIPFAVLIIPFLIQQAVFRTENLFWLLLITLPLSTEVNFTPSLGMDLPDELLMMLLTGFVMIKWICNKNFISIDIYKTRLFSFLSLHILWIFVTCIYSVDAALSFKYFLAKTWFIIPFVFLPQLFLNNKENIRKALFCLIIPMMFVVIQSLVRHGIYNFSFEGVKDVLYPFFRNHVNYSAFLACCIPILWYADKFATGKWKGNIKIALWLSIIALFFAYSRGAWLALLMGIVTVFVIKRKLMLQSLLAACIIISVSVAWLITDNNYLRFRPNYEQTIFHKNFSEHLGATVEMKDLSNAERFYRWIAGARMFADKPVTGFGPNTFYSNYRFYTVEQFRTYVSGNPEHSSVHNYFLLLALEQGLPGMIIFMLLLSFMLLQAQKLYHAIVDTFYKIAALLIGVILVMITVVNSMSDMIETDKIGSLFWLCFGILIILSKKSKERIFPD